MLAAVEDVTAHWPRGSRHIEHFTPKAIEPDGPDEAIEVEFAASVVTATVPHGRSILTVADEAGFVTAFSCARATAEHARHRSLEGRADHRDSLLTEDEREAHLSMMICVSRAERGCSRLRLDL